MPAAAADQRLKAPVLHAVNSNGGGGVYCRDQTKLKQSIDYLLAKSMIAFKFRHRLIEAHLTFLVILLLLLLLRLFVACKIPSRRLQMHCPAVRKCSCLYTMYHINNNVFSCVLKVVRLQSDIRNAVGKQFF